MQFLSYKSQDEIIFVKRVCSPNAAVKSNKTVVPKNKSVNLPGMSANLSAVPIDDSALPVVVITFFIVQAKLDVKTFLLKFLSIF